MSRDAGKVDKKRKLEALGNDLERAETSEEIHRLVNMNDEDDEVLLNETSLKKIVLRMEKAISKNQNQRIKFVDEPKKFMSSEIALNEAIEDVKTLSTCPSLFHLFVSLGALDSCFSLLAHENIDIVSAILNLIHELLDIDTEEEEEHRQLLVDGIVKMGGLSSIVLAMNRLDEQLQEDFDTYGNVLSVFEKMIESSASVAELLCSETSILDTLCNRVGASVRSHDQNKYDAAELLSIVLLNGGEKCCTMFMTSSTNCKGVLSALEPFLSRDPSKGDEREFVENLFDVFACSLLVPGTRVAFGESSALEFAHRAVKSKRFVRHPALKLLNTATDRCAVNCALFVELGGLKSMFAAFMKGDSKARKKYKVDVDEEEEHIVCIIAHLFMYIPGPQYHRLLAKFTERSYQKVDRLVDLHLKFDEKLETEVESDNVMRPGQFALQMIDLLIGFVFTAGDVNLKSHLSKLLDQYDVSMVVIKKNLQEYRDSIGDEEVEEKVSEYTPNKSQPFHMKVIDSVINLLEC